MTKKQVIDSLLKWGLKLDQPGRSKTCIERFCVEMEGRRYGLEETADAFLWFEKGWQGAQRRLE